MNPHSDDGAVYSQHIHDSTPQSQPLLPTLLCQTTYSDVTNHWCCQVILTWLPEPGRADVQPGPSTLQKNTPSKHFTMNDLNPHTCSRCREIIIDLTKPSFEQEYRYTFDCVATYAKDCAFFQWAHNITVSCSTSELKITFEYDPSRLHAVWTSSSECSRGAYIGSGALHGFVREG